MALTQNDAKIVMGGTHANFGWLSLPCIHTNHA